MTPSSAPLTTFLFVKKIIYLDSRSAFLQNLMLQKRLRQFVTTENKTKQRKTK